MLPSNMMNDDPGPGPGVLPFLSLLLSACLLFTGCATTVPRDYERTPSAAFDRPQDTELGHFFEAELAAHPGKSGVIMLSTSEWGFRARVGLANMAEKTLDVQYYIWEVDNTGSVLAERLLRAADRGVRVRLLLDDINLEDTDYKFARMGDHPNIEIRLFNPFSKRKSRISEFVFNLDRLNHRMHNKAFIADNAIAIVGGRNIGDDYFGVDTVANFRDLDLALAGPVVADVSRSFDEFWNSEWAIPVSELVEEELSGEEFQAKKAALYHWVENLHDYPYSIDLTSEALFGHLEEYRGNFIWTPVNVLYDAPDKIETKDKDLEEQLVAVGAEKEHEVLAEIAYFIPGARSMERIRLNNERGIRQRVLTNSLATNDVAAAHAGYAKYRRDLIRNGVELYELRPDASAGRKNWSLLAGTSKASLHTKAYVQDRETVAIGSFNHDPRSAALNTEVMILVESPELAAQVVAYMDNGVLPENSYRVMLEPGGDWSGERLVWITENDGEEVRYYTDPAVSPLRRFSVWFMGLLPIEEHL